VLLTAWYKSWLSCGVKRCNECRERRCELKKKKGNTKGLKMEGYGVVDATTLENLFMTDIWN